LIAVPTEEGTSEGNVSEDRAGGGRSSCLAEGGG
jgi:hypothetical protein